VNSGTLNALGIDKITLPQVNLYPYHTVLAGDAQLDGKRGDVIFALETPSLHARGHVANWITFGTGGERLWQSKSIGSDITSGLCTYRSYVALADWTQIVNPPFSLQQLQQTLSDVKQASDLSKHQTPSTGNTELDSFIVNETAKYGGSAPPPGVQSQGPPTGDLWPLLTADYNALIHAYAWAPANVLSLQSDGRYKYTGEPQGPRGKMLGALVFTHYWGYHGQAYSNLDLRYELGWDWATNQHLDRLIVDIGLVF
jgi:hypothetical protein